jgi:hypothetical protein
MMQVSLDHGFTQAAELWSALSLSFYLYANLNNTYGTTNPPIVPWNPLFSNDGTTGGSPSSLVPPIENAKHAAATTLARLEAMSNNKISSLIPDQCLGSKRHPFTPGPLSMLMAATQLPMGRGMGCMGKIYGFEFPWANGLAGGSGGTTGGVSAFPFPIVSCALVEGIGLALHHSKVNYILIVNRPKFSPR